MGLFFWVFRQRWIPVEGGFFKRVNVENVMMQVTIDFGHMMKEKKTVDVHRTAGENASLWRTVFSDEGECLGFCLI